MSTEQNGGIAKYVGIWIGLICIAGIEVLLTYRGFSTHELLGALFILAIIEAGIGLAYFMHLKYESPSLVWTLIPFVIFVLLMMNQIWPDAYRVDSLRFLTQ
jgi:cytochrome c oxidase subunit IV